MSAKKIDALLNIWARDAAEYGGDSPFHDARRLYKTIDATVMDDVKWESFTVKYTGSQPHRDVPSWMTAGYEVWYRDPLKMARQMLANPDYENEMDYCAKQEFMPDGQRRLKDFMSGDWAWRHSVRHFPLSAPTYIYPIRPRLLRIRLRMDLPLSR